MAKDTGGRAFVNTNDLSHAIADAIRNGSSYYTLTYAPTAANWDGNFRKIQVNLNQHGYTLAYRRGYYAIDSNAPTTAKPNTKAATPQDAPATLSPPDPMRTAMLRGSPNPTQIIFKARILPASTTAEEAPVTGNKANPDAKLSHGPYKRYNVDIAADPRSFVFIRSADGKFHSHVELRTYVFDQDGQLIVEGATGNRTEITAEVLNTIARSGFPLHQQISVPIKGNYYIRIGVHDLNGERIGALEVPVTSVKDLTPLPATANTGATN
jgi:hypothetical protein